MATEDDRNEVALPDRDCSYVEQKHPHDPHEWKVYSVINASKEAVNTTAFMAQCGGFKAVENEQCRKVGEHHLAHHWLRYIPEGDVQEYKTANFTVVKRFCKGWDGLPDIHQEFADAMQREGLTMQPSNPEDALTEQFTAPIDFGNEQIAATVQTPYGNVEVVHPHYYTGQGMGCWTDLEGMGRCGLPPEAPQHIKATKLESLNFGPQPIPMFGINDDDGNSLVEFRLKNGIVEAKYYPQDLDDAAKHFIKYMMSLQQKEQ